PDLETHDEEVVALAHLVLIDRWVLGPEEREPRLEVHVDHETDAGDQPERAEKKRDAPVAAARELESEHSEGNEQERDAHHHSRGQRPTPLPRAVLEEVEKLLPKDLERPAGIVRTGIEHRVIEETAAAELFAPDDREQVAPVLRIGLVEHGVQTGADIKESV